MNQSLDADEVLNVRWATEDPNPTAKVYEYERLVEMGKKGIGSKLTPEFIMAVRKMDELEGIVERLEVDYEGDVRQIGNGKNKRSIEDANGASAKRIKAQEPAQPISQAKGLLSGSAMDSLKKAAALRKAKAQKAAAAAATAKA